MPHGDNMRTLEGLSGELSMRWIKDFILIIDVRFLDSLLR